MPLHVCAASAVLELLRVGQQVAGDHVSQPLLIEGAVSWGPAAWQEYQLW
jgi:hypothetical protein